MSVTPAALTRSLGTSLECYLADHFIVGSGCMTAEGLTEDAEAAFERVAGEFDLNDPLTRAQAASIANDIANDLAHTWATWLAETHAQIEAQALSWARGIAAGEEVI